MKRIMLITLIATFCIMANAQNAEEIINQIRSLSKAGNYNESITLLQKNESILIQANELSFIYGSFSWYYLFTKNFMLSEQAAYKLLEIDSTETWIKAHLAHALLFQGKTAEAERIYNELANTIEDFDDTYTFKILNDFEQLEQADIVPSGSKKDFERIKTDINKIHQAIEVYKQFVNDLFTSDEYDEKTIGTLQPHISFLPEKHAYWSAIYISNIGEEYFYLNDFIKAEQFYLEAKNIREQVLGKEHPYYATSVNNLGLLYYTMGDYVQAEKFYLEAKNIREQVLRKEHPDYATTVFYLGMTYSQTGNFSQSENYYLEAKNIYEKAYGKEHPNYLFVASRLGELYFNLSDYVQAEKYYLEVKNFWEKVSGKEHPEYAISLNGLAKIYYQLGDFSQAEKYHLDAKNINEKTLGKEHPNYATTLFEIGHLYSKLGDYAQAETYLLEAKNIYEKVFGKEHPAYATSVNNLGLLYYELRDYAQTESYLLEAKNIREKILGKEHPDYATTVNNLGSLYQDLGDYTQAEKYYLEAKNIREKVLGKEHPDYAGSVNNFGLLYYELGDYAQAESYLLEAKNIREKILGKEHPDYATTVNNLGSLYQDLGDYTQAEKYYLEAKNIREKVLGKEHPDYATSLNNFGGLYLVLEDYVQVEKYYLEANNVLEKTLGKEHRNYATSINNLGVLYYMWKKYTQAETYYLEAKNIRERALGKEHPDNAGSVNNLGGLYFKMEDYVQAEKYFIEAINFVEKVLGKEHPYYLASAKNLKELYQAMNDYEKAICWNTKYCDLVTSSVDKNFAFLSEQQRSRYWETQQYGFIGSYALSWFHPVASIHSLNYNNTLFTKGLLLRTTNGIRDAIYASGNTELISQYEQLGNLRAEIGNLQQKDDFSRDYVQTLENRADSLDKAITRSSQAYSDLKADLSMTWQDVQQQLKSDEAAIEFVDFRLYDTNWTDTTVYAALVLRQGMDAPEWIPLCEQKDLQAFFDRTKVGQPVDRLKINTLYNIFGNELYSLIWQPLEKELEGIGRIYYAPSGLLHKVPFDAIPVDGARLFDKYEMKLVSSTREIKRLKEERAEEARGFAVIYGGIDFDAGADSLIIAAKPYPQSTGTRSFNSETRGSAWVPLPGTKAQMDSIATYLQNHHVDYKTFTGVDGNEESFKNLSGKHTQQIVISTHGFFLEDIQKSDIEDIIRRLGGGVQKPFENPLLRSGLVFAGGNRVFTGQSPIDGIEDGILTADEISKLNLLNTRLVMLSACQTGLGEVQNSEGVFGLQRAFKLAGVESLIMSLWEVDDKATQIMMSKFYENWLGGKTKQEAFRIAQKTVREYVEFDYSSPYYWAAFVMMD